MNKESKQGIPNKFRALLKNGQEKEVFLSTWYDHAVNGTEIESFTTLVGDKLYHIQPNEDEIFIPFSEYYGDHSECFILALNLVTGKELFRKNTRTVDMVHWKLSLSQTNIKKDESDKREKS